MTALVYSCAPVAEDIAYAIGELSPNTAAIQAAITTALQGMHLRKAAVGGDDRNERDALPVGLERSRRRGGRYYSLRHHLAHDGYHASHR